MKKLFSRHGEEKDKDAPNLPESQEGAGSKLTESEVTVRQRNFDLETRGGK